MQRHSSSAESSKNVRVQVSAPYFWDFGVYERIFSTSTAVAENGNGSSALESNGQEMRSSTPVGSSSSTSDVSRISASSLTPTSDKRPQRQPPLSDDDLTTYVVSFDETFESIALKHDMTAVELRRVNPGVPFFSRPIPGQELRVKKLRKNSINSEESKGEVDDGSPRQQFQSSLAEEHAKQHEVVERKVALCIGPTVRVPGRLIVGISSGFILFEPFEAPASSSQPRMLFALDRRDVMGCAAVSRITARLSPEDEVQAMLLQMVWRCPELGFSSQQQVFFEVPNVDIPALVDAVYAAELDQKGAARPASRTLTSGIAALRALEEQQRSAVIEDYVTVTLPDAEDLLTDVTMLPRDSKLISRNQAVSLAKALPPRLQNGSWQLVYDFDEHGVSLHALFSAAKNHPETLLMVRDMNSREVVGVFAAQAWDYAGRAGSFFGTGETIVFRFKHNDSDVEVHPWSGANEFFQTCSTTHLAVGGGGSFALCLDADLLHCTSGPCKTFQGLETRSLSTAQSFTMDGIELWALHALGKARSSTLGSMDERARSPRGPVPKQSFPAAPPLLEKDEDGFKRDEDGFVKL
jgi:LysM repeat protein